MQSTKRLRRRPLTIREILLWASAFREVTGHWPTKNDGAIVGARGETWLGVDSALRDGLRRLPGGSSLAQLLAEEKGRRNIQNLPPLTEELILHRADEHYQRTGQWPTRNSGVIPHSDGENWRAIDQALRKGVRQLPGGSSLARLLSEQRGVRNRKQLPPFVQQTILKWADAHFRQHQAYPTAASGPIGDAPGETWLAVDMALRHGRRQLPGGSSLALLLAEHRGVRNSCNPPELSIDLILSWIDAHQQRTGRWPQPNSGPIPEAPGETWCAVNHALRCGTRGLPCVGSLAQLLGRERGVRNLTSIPKLTRQQILLWADAHQRRTGELPTRDSGPIPEAPGDTWRTVDEALRHGYRKLRGGSSLARLLAQQRHKRNPQDLPPLSKKKIMVWADAHVQQTGQWPNVNSGPVAEAPEERWDLIDNALRQGHRHLPGGSSLRQLLAQKRGVRNPQRLAPLAEEQIKGWAEDLRQRTGTLPKYDSGPVLNAPGETWAGVDYALRYGKRALPGGSSLAKLLNKEG